MSLTKNQQAKLSRELNNELLTYTRPLIKEKYNPPLGLNKDIIRQDDQPRRSLTFSEPNRENWQWSIPTQQAKETNKPYKIQRSHPIEKHIDPIKLDKGISKMGVLSVNQPLHHLVVEHSFTNKQIKAVDEMVKRCEKSLKSQKC